MGLAISISTKRYSAIRDAAFLHPWTAELTPNCFVVRDANGQALSYVYYENEPGRRSAAKLLSDDEAWRCRNYCRASLACEPA
jgi:hypothetical protein